MARAVAASVLSVLLLAGCAGATVAPSADRLPMAAAPSTSPFEASPPSTSPTALPSPTPLPSSTPLPAPTPTPSPWTSSTKPLAWHRLASITRSGTTRVIGELEGSPINGFVGFAKGYAVLDGQVGAVWYSSNGRKWKSVTLPIDRAQAKMGGDANGLLGRAIATNGRELLVVGGYSHGPCRPNPPGSAGGGPECPVAPISWISSDGLHWRSSKSTLASMHGEFVAVWPVAGGGWNAALSDWYGECLGGDTLWRSADGISWTRLTKAPPAAWEGYDRVPLGIASESGRYLLAASERGDPHLTLATRAAGESWSVLHGFPGEGAEVIAGAAPVGDRTRWVLAGRSGATVYCEDDAGAGCGVGAPTIWSSAGGVNWTAIVLPVGSGVAALEPGDPPVTVSAVTSLVLSDRGYVAVGAEGDPTEGSRHETWVSADGVSWTMLPGAGRPRFDYGPGLVADGPAGVIGISGSKAEDELVVWQLR
jgi:hypothetical protein